MQISTSASLVCPSKPSAKHSAPTLTAGIAFGAGSGLGKITIDPPAINRTSTIPPDLKRPVLQAIQYQILHEAAAAKTAPNEKIKNIHEVWVCSHWRPKQPQTKSVKQSNHQALAFAKGQSCFLFSIRRPLL